MAFNMNLKAPTQGRTAIAQISSRSVSVAAQKTETNKLTAAVATASVAIMASAPAFAANEMTQLAEDNRINALFLLLLPAIGWVGLNIFGPISNQLEEMKKKKDSLAVAGLITTAALATSQSSYAAQEVAQVAGATKLASVGLFIVAAGIWIAMYLAADNNPKAEE